MSNQEASEEVPSTVNVNVSGQGAQVGTGGTLINNWGQRQPLDSSYLSALNPHVAVARLQRLTHEELVDFFARAAPSDLSEIFPTFLESDKARVIETLADINGRKAAKLIESCSVDSALVTLPEAAKAIARKAADLRWTDAGPMERFGTGYARRYNKGRIFWGARIGVHVTVGVMDDYSTASGPTWGFPIGDEGIVPDSPFGTEGVAQEFQIGTVYSSKHGVYRVIEEQCYGEEGGTFGWLGFPVGEVQLNPRIGAFQNFEGGLIYSGLGQGKVAFAVRRDVADAMPSIWEACPLSKETSTTSSSGMTGSVQEFECLDWETFKAVVYSPEGHDSLSVSGDLLGYYGGLGGEKSWLGFPTSSADWVLKRAYVQSFEAGVIYLITGVGPVSVSNAFAKLAPDGCAPYEVLGLPRSDEQPIGADGSGRIQFFDNAVVTLQDGKAEMWLRPRSDLAPIIYVDLRPSEPKPWWDALSEPEDDGFVDD